MKPRELKQEYIRLRAEGRAYSYIADNLHISKSTCTKWEKELEAEIAQIKREELNTLYDTYHMRKEDRIKKLGDTLEKVETALDATEIVKALGDLLNRVRAGEVTTEQASRESLILSNLLKAYETVEVKAKLDALEAVIGGRG